MKSKKHQSPENVVYKSWLIQKASFVKEESHVTHSFAKHNHQIKGHQKYLRVVLGV